MSKLIKIIYRMGFLMEEEKKSIIINILNKIIFYVSIVVIMVGFNFQDRQTGWFVQYTPSGGRTISDIKFLDTLNGVAITDRGTNADTSYILKTTNGGINWNIIYGFYGGALSLSIPDSSIWYISGAKTGTGEGRVLKTTNKGVNWFEAYASSGPPFERCFFVNRDTGWITSSAPTFGGIWRTTDGGASWQMQAGGIITAVFFIDNNTGWYSQGNGSGTLFKTTNTGNNWVNIKYFPNNGLEDVFFKNLDTGWITGGGLGTGIGKTTDGGFNWIAQQNPGNTSGGKLFFNNKRGWLGQSLSQIFVCLNEENWGTQNMPTWSNYTVIFFDTLAGWAGTSKIVHTNDGGGPISKITNNNEQIAKDFILYQNYPNPFNSVSSIKYKVSRSADIKLILYSIDGKEITILLNKRQVSGDYDIKFYGSNLSSGVYFYTLFVEGVRVDTKKLVLIK